ASMRSGEAGEAWRPAPGVQNPDQPAVGDGLSGHVVQAVSQAEPVEHCAQSEAIRVEDQLAFHAYCNRATIFVELPRQQAAVGWQPYADAFVLCQVLRSFWPRVTLEIGRCADD